MSSNPTQPFSYMRKAVTERNTLSTVSQQVEPNRVVNRNARRDIHGYAKRLKLAYRRLETEPSCTRRDRNAIRGFCQYLTANGINDGRVAKALFQLIVLRRHLPCQFHNADRKAIEALLTWLNIHENYSPWTKADAKGWIKRFVKWMKYGSTSKENPFPPEVAWISTHVKRNELREPLVLTSEEAEKMIYTASPLWQKSYIAISNEGGFRVGEILTAKVGDVTFDQHGARLMVRGKTGFRPVRLITSAPLLARYMQEHREKGNPESPLWLSSSKRYSDPRPICYHSIVRMLKEVAKNAGVKKRIHTHIFRHTAATRDARFLTEAELRIKYGWDRSSDQPATYVHLASRDVDDKLISTYSGFAPEPKKPDFAPIICARCDEKNTPGVRFCGRCASPLNPVELAKETISDARLDAVERMLEEALGKKKSGEKEEASKASSGSL